MNRTTNRIRLATLVLAGTAALAVAACPGGGDAEDKAGGSHEPLVLLLANTNGQLDFTPALVDFVDRVEELSGGDLRIEAVDEWGNFASDAEQRVVKDVSDGETDLGWVGTRVFDTLGVKDFQALTAPMLVDSYALEGAVIESGITEQMMQGLADLGVAGLGVLPDGLRKPIGVTGPILGPADWQGITFGTLRSHGQAGAIGALGATPAQVHREEREEGLEHGTIQGFETSIWSHRHDPELAVLAPYVTSNVTLWPQMDVLLANPARLEALTGEQREVAGGGGPRRGPISRPGGYRRAGSRRVLCVRRALRRSLRRRPRRARSRVRPRLREASASARDEGLQSNASRHSSSPPHRNPSSPSRRTAPAKSPSKPPAARGPRP